MEKENIIKKIKTIIELYGSFGIGEVQSDCAPLINEMGNLVALGEYFDYNVTVYIYDPFISDAIDSYEIAYEQLSIEVLKEILELAEQYEVNQEETLK